MPVDTLLERGPRGSRPTFELCTNAGQRHYRLRDNQSPSLSASASILYGVS